MLNALIGPALGAAALTVAATFVANLVLREQTERRRKRALVVALRAEIGERKKRYLDLLVAQAAETVETGRVALQSLHSHPPRRPERDFAIQ